MTQGSDVVGRVLRASTSGFDCGTRSSSINGNQNFGAFVTVPITDDQNQHAVGLIYAIRIDDDPLARELVMAANVDNNALLDHRENRMVPVEICVINVGYAQNGAYYYNLPPRPPMSLIEVRLMTSNEVCRFTEQTDFIRLVLNARDVKPDELLAAALIYASYAYPESERYDFMVRCGRRTAQLLSHDLKRLSHILSLISPPEPIS
ncbi:MAG: hypothetical protein IAE89_15725 [Anaerolineae bacterium]|nr:hypothetical protein [Anaerolineae bacterium]